MLAAKMKIMNEMIQWEFICEGEQDLTEYLIQALEGEITSEELGEIIMDNATEYGLDYLEWP